MTRVVARPRIRIALFMVLSDAFALAGLSYLANGHVVADRNWLGVALGCVLTICGGLGVWRALRLGVVIDQSGLLVRRFAAADKTLTWTAVRSISPEKLFLRGGRPFFAPVLEVDGLGRLSVQELGSHAVEEAERNAADLRGLQGSPQSYASLVAQN